MEYNAVRGYGPFYPVIIFGCVVLSVFILVDEHTWKLYLYIFSAFLLYLSWYNVISLLDILFRMENSGNRYTEDAVGLFTLLADFLLFVIFILLILCEKKSGWMIRFTEKEIVLITIFCMVFPVMGEDVDGFWNLVRYVACVLIMNIVIFYGMIYRKNARYYRDISENYRQRFYEEYTYFENFRREQKNIAKFRHDWNNHLILLTSMFEKEEYEKARQYFEALADKNKTGENKILTGNEIVDIILNAKYDRCIEEAITILCSNGMEALQFLEPVDCCILFSNLIDNAIEANCKCDADRYITINMCKTAGTIMLSIENRINGKPKSESERLNSTKEDGDFHGIGTQNVFEVIKKYHGDYRIVTAENTFTFQVLFPFS